MVNLRLQCLNNKNNSEDANNPATTNLRCCLAICCNYGVNQSHDANALLRFLSKVDV